MKKKKTVEHIAMFFSLSLSPSRVYITPSILHFYVCSRFDFRIWCVKSIVNGRSADDDELKDDDDSSKM